MTITIGTWAIPLAVTVAIWAWAVLQPSRQPTSSYDFGGAADALVRLVVALPVSLIAWLIWALLR